MKKITFLILSGLLLLNCISCSKDGASNDNSDFVGQWVFSHEVFFIDGKPVTLNEGEYLTVLTTDSEEYSFHPDSSMEQVFPITFKKDGYVNWIMNLSCPYEVSGNKAVLKGPTGEVMVLMREGENLVWVEDELEIVAYAIVHDDDVHAEGVTSALANSYKNCWYYRAVK